MLSSTKAKFTTGPPSFYAVASATDAVAALVSANASKTWTMNVTAGDLAVVWIWTYSGSSSATNIASGYLTTTSYPLTLVPGGEATNGNGHLWCYTVIAPSTGLGTFSITNGSVAADIAANSLSYHNATAGAFYGANGSSAAASVTATAGAGRLISCGIGAVNALTNTSSQTQRGTGGAGNEFILVSDALYPTVTGSASLTSGAWAAGALVLL